MRPSIILTIARKELLETLRDRRTLFMMVGLPILLYPMLIIAFSWFQESQDEAREERRSTVAVWGEAPSPLLNSLREASRIDVAPGAALPGDVRRGLASGALSAPPATRRPGARADEEPTLEEENPVLAAARLAIASRQANAVLVVWPGFTSAVDRDAFGQVSIYFD